MSRSLDGRVAVVTGAGGGLGRAEAIGLAADGATVIVNDLAASLDASDVLDVIGSAGGRAVPVTGDIADAATAAEIMRTATDDLGGLDIVMSNAGITRDAPFHKMTPEQWHQVIDTNLTGVFNTVHPVWPGMRERGGGIFVIVASAAGLLAKPIRQLSQINSVIQRGLSAAYSIFSLIDEAPEKDQGSHTSERAAGRIKFKDVGFSYNDATLSLDGISFVAEPGQTIALVGKSGSGKSSLVSLIPRFYELDQGTITLDGIPIQQYSLHNLRQHISLVSQKVVLFDGTVAENIA
ncbi:SDR family NAD(P)-dependent oxidoreductase, partial [Mycolicibacterium poriferae]|uniref:SDR family NAD(P)-dependent oxidoreductase n=1 Tax=Mycolicibacterium poriferae TaxID=39694 RepID=UPI0032194089